MTVLVELTPEDSGALSRLVRLAPLPEADRQEIMDDIVDPAAREVAEAFLDKEKYQQASDPVRATVDRFREWRESNRLARERAKPRRASHP